MAKDLVLLSGSVIVIMGVSSNKKGRRAPSLIWQGAIDQMKALVVSMSHARPALPQATFYRGSST
jgi:hypothetical protein